MKIDVNLNPKQAQAFRYLMDEVTTDILFGGAASGGKCVIYNTLVTLSNGERRQICELKKGDSVLAVDKDGNIVRSLVTGKVSVGKKRGYNFRISGGDSVTVSKDHPFLLNRDGKLEWLVASSVKVGDLIGVPQKVPTDDIDKYSLTEYELFGYLIGNGSLTRNAYISMGNQEAIDRLATLIPKGYTLVPHKTKTMDFGIR